MKLLTEPDMVDTELLVYAMTLINKTLNGIPDQDTYYDQVDAIEEQGIEQVIQKYNENNIVTVKKNIDVIIFSGICLSREQNLIFSDNFRFMKWFCNMKMEITNLLRSG